MAQTDYLPGQRLQAEIWTIQSRAIKIMREDDPKRAPAPHGAAMSPDAGAGEG